MLYDPPYVSPIHQIWFIWFSNFVVLQHHCLLGNLLAFSALLTFSFICICPWTTSKVLNKFCGALWLVHVFWPVLDMSTEGWNTPKYSLYGFSIKAHQLTQIWRFLPTICFCGTLHVCVQRYSYLDFYFSSCIVNPVSDMSGPYGVRMPCIASGWDMYLFFHLYLCQGTSEISYSSSRIGVIF